MSSKIVEELQQEIQKLQLDLTKERETSDRWQRMWWLADDQMKLTVESQYEDRVYIGRLEGEIQRLSQPRTKDLLTTRPSYRISSPTSPRWEPPL